MEGCWLFDVPLDLAPLCSLCFCFFFFNVTFRGEEEEEPFPLENEFKSLFSKAFKMLIN